MRNVVDTCRETETGKKMVERNRSCRNGKVAVITIMQLIKMTHYINKECALCNGVKISRLYCFPVFLSIVIFFRNRFH